MVCKGLEILTDNTILGILQFPTSCDYYFYFKIMAAFFIIIAMLLYNQDRDKFLKSDMISALGVSGIATIFVSLLGTLIKIIQQDVFIEILVICSMFIIFWLVKR